jgi:hypothetical protein
MGKQVNDGLNELCSSPVTIEVITKGKRKKEGDKERCFSTTLSFVSFRSPSLFYLFTAGVEVVYFHLITLRHTQQSV